MKAPRFVRWLMRVGACLLIVLPALAHAETPHTLAVTLRDVHGSGIADATITVRDEAGTSDLAHTTTNAQGTATLPNLTAAIVRVAVSGTLADGTPLSQRGQDAHGIWLMLDAPLVPLDLRSELNGAIVPDPTSMISADAPIPATPEMTTLALPDSVHRGVPTAIPFAPLPADHSPNALAIRPALIGRGLVIMSVLISLLLFMFWLVWRRRASR